MNGLEEAASRICEICHMAWKKNLMVGWSGNASLRLEEGILITAAGVAKGFLKPGDCLLVSEAGKILCGSGQPSSESGAHLAIYNKFPQCGAILHTHPPALQALEAANPESGNLRASLAALPLHEVELWIAHLQYVPTLRPGSPQVAKAVGSISFNVPPPQAIWLSRHGLICMGVDLLDCFCLAEELEHLARVALAVR